MLFYLILLFITMPLLEIALLVKVSAYLHLGGTLLLVIVTGIIGASLARWQGGKQLALIQTELSQGRVPGPSVIDGVLILIAGIVLLTPGLITDAAGFLLLIPMSRACIRRWLRSRFEHHVHHRVIQIDPHDIEEL